MIPVSIYKISQSQEVFTHSVSYTVVLKSINDNRAFSMIVGEVEALSMLAELKITPLNFPLTHDIMKNTLTSMDAKINKVTITEIKNGVYYSVISLVKGEEAFEIDSRPSDAIALALRFNSPIYVSKKVMNASSYTLGDKKVSTKDDKSICTRDEYIDNKLKVDGLKILLRDAVKDEDYEKAAQIRDELKKLGE